jgi:ketosteroid isomerase-like protein
MTERPSATGDTSSAQANLALIQSFYDAIQHGDVPAMFDLIDPGVDWRVPASLPWGGTFTGHDGIREFLAKVSEQQVEWHREVHELFAAGQHVVATLTLSGRPTGRDTEFTVPELHLWSVSRGKIVRFDSFFDTALVLNAIGVNPLK